GKRMKTMRSRSLGVHSSLQGGSDMKVRTRLFQLLVVIVPLSLAGCLPMILPKPAEPSSKPEPPANPANLDKYFQPKQGNHPAEVEMTDIGSWEFMNWQPGQFSVLGTYVDGVQKAVNRTFLVSRDGDVWVIEATHIDDRGQKTVTQTAASGFQPGTKAKPNVKWMKTQDKDGKVTKLDNALGLAIANAALSAGSGPTMT